MSVVVIRMQGLAYEFSQIFPGHAPSPPQRGGGYPSALIQARPVAGGYGVYKRPGVVNFRGPLNFSAVVAPLADTVRVARFLYDD